MGLEQATCGQELAASAIIPEKLGQLWAHVAENLEAHARSVDTSTSAGAAEHHGLSELAVEYHAIARAAERASAIMTSMRDIPATPHGPSNLDRAEHARRMQRKISLQSELAELLLEHARTSRAVLEASLTGELAVG